MTRENETTGQQPTFHLPLDVFAITSFICTGFYLFTYSILIKYESFSLHSFQQRIIGMAVLDGVDVVARTRLYLYALVLTGILALVLLLLLEKILDSIIPEDQFGKERFFLALFSLFGTTNLMLGILIKNSVFLFNIYLVLCLVWCVLSLIVVKKITIMKKPQNLLLFDDLPFTCSIILATVTAIFALLVLMGGPFSISLPVLIGYSVLYSILLVFLLLYCPDRFPQILDNNFRGIIVNSLLPLSLFPVSIPLTNEFQYWLSRWISVDPRTLSLGFLFFVVLSSLLFFKQQVMKNHPFMNPESSVENITFPAILAAFSLYANYVSTPSFAQIQIANLFEHGLTSTIVQQLFDFGKIPNIHLVSPHGFSDTYFAILYSVFNGYQPIDCFLWQWLTPVLIALAGYFFFKEFVEGHIACVLMIFLPVFGIVSFNNFFILIPAILFVRFWKNPRLDNYLLLLIAFLFCFIWRLEAGVASVLAFFLLSILLFFPLRKKTPAVLWEKYCRYIYATLGILGFCTLMYASICVITGISPISAFQSVVNLYSIQEARGTYTSLYLTYNAPVALQFAIFPLFGLGVVIFFIWTVIARRKTVTAQFILIAFIAIGTLFLSQRGTQRHSQIEVFSYYYFPLIACSLPLLWYRTKQFLSIILLILVLSTGFFIAQYPLATIHNDYSKKFFEFRSWDTHETRVQIQENDIKTIANLTEYLRDHLRSDETYYDMSNFIMPYTLLRKEYLPNSLFHMIQTGENYQNETIKRLVQNRDRVPVVVTGGWQMDGVPNELRTYRISEYVFTHYKPLGKIDDFEIWIRNDLDAGDFDTSNDEDYQIYAMDTLSTNDLTYTNQQGTVVLQSGSNNPYVSNISRTYPLQSGSKYTGFHLVYTSDTDGPLQVFYSGNYSSYSENESISGTISRANHFQDFYGIFPADIHDITNIRIDPPNNSSITLKSVYVYPLNSALIANKSIVRDYNLRDLPYIWGTFDLSDPVSHQPVQDLIFYGEQKIPAETPVSFPNIDPAIDKSTGNYLLITLKSENDGNITLVYGNLTDSAITVPAVLHFNVIPSEKKQNYLIRISSQWDWYAHPVTYLELTSSTPVTLYECKILKGD